jgi:hypothetical protein
MTRKSREELMLRRAEKLLVVTPTMISPQARRYWAAHRDRIEREAHDQCKYLAAELLRVAGANGARKFLDDTIKADEEIRKAPCNRPQEPDAFTLIVAADIQQRTSCKKRTALRQAMAALGVPEEKLRRLEDKLRGKTLQQFVEALPFKPRALSLAEFMAGADPRTRALSRRGTFRQWGRGRHSSQPAWVAMRASGQPRISKRQPRRCSPRAVTIGKTSSEISSRARQGTHARPPHQSKPLKKRLADPPLRKRARPAHRPWAN